MKVESLEEACSLSAEIQMLEGLQKDWIRTLESDRFLLLKFSSETTGKIKQLGLEDFYARIADILCKVRRLE